jgi:nucleoside-diphosphate-sugar epimerase
MKILVTGAAGFLGRSVIAMLALRGRDFRAVVRRLPVDAGWPENVGICICDLAVDDLSSALADVEIVLHLAGHTAVAGTDVTALATERLCAAVRGTAVRHFVHVSSLAVYDWSGTAPMIDENSPLVPSAVAPTKYTKSKVRQEQAVAALADADVTTTILRPGFIWGTPRIWIDGVGRQLPGCYLLVSPDAPVPLTYVENCADVVVKAVDCSWSGTFNVVDYPSVSRGRYLDEYIRNTGRFGVVVPVSYGFGLRAVAAISNVVGKMSWLDKMPSLLDPVRFEAQFKPVTVTSDKIRREMQWHPPLDFEECVRRSLGAGTRQNSISAVQ